VTREKIQHTARLRATHENVSSRTRPSFLAVPAVGGTFLLLLLAAAGYAQTVRTADAQAFVASPLPDKHDAANEAAGLTGSTSVSGVGIEAAPDWTDQRSPETYIGYREAQNFASPGKVHRNSTQSFSAPANLPLNHWGLAGSWNVNAESAVLQAATGKIVFRFQSRDLNLVLAPAKDGKPARFFVRLDGAAPAESHGVDTAPNRSGEIREPRLYQLIRQNGPITDRAFEIEFLDAGVQALDFTFGWRHTGVLEDHNEIA